MQRLDLFESLSWKYVLLIIIKMFIPKAIICTCVFYMSRPVKKCQIKILSTNAVFSLFSNMFQSGNKHLNRNQVYIVLFSLRWLPVEICSFHPCRLKWYYTATHIHSNLFHCHPDSFSIQEYSKIAFYGWY